MIYSKKTICLNKSTNKIWCIVESGKFILYFRPFCGGLYFIMIRNKKKVILKKLNLKKLKSMLSIKRKIAKVFVLLPINNKKIVFDNFAGRGYGCDPKYICDELLKRNLDLDLVWLTNEDNHFVPNGVRVVRYGSFRAFWELSTAHIWVDNVKTSYKPNKRKKQFYLQTWHSSLGLKNNEALAKEVLPTAYIRIAQKDSKMTDLMYSNNNIRKRIYENSFFYSGKVIKCSVPRCSALFDGKIKAENNVRDFYNISSEKTIILFAPTFRKQDNIELYKFDYDKCIEEIKRNSIRIFGQEKNQIIFLIKLHPKLERTGVKYNFNGSILDVTRYPDFQELLAACSVLISDYSACIFDACFVKKPVFLYIPDYDHYVKQDRGTFFAVEDLPFYYSFSENQLFENIRKFDCVSYNIQCEKFCEKIGLEENGNGPQYIADLLLDKIYGTDSVM